MVERALLDFQYYITNAAAARMHDRLRLIKLELFKTMKYFLTCRNIRENKEISLLRTDLMHNSTL